jgi:hypothetical protein
MTAVDEEGRAVTLIQSLYAHFGSGLLEPETGIVLHNRGGGFSLEPGHPGCLAPGARPWSIIGDSGWVVSSILPSTSAFYAVHIPTGKMGTRPLRFAPRMYR